MEIKVCPSTLAPGHSEYSRAALRRLFYGKSVTPFLDIDFDKDIDRKTIADNVGRISVSGAQEKMAAVVDNGVIRLAKPDERSTHILKPAPLDYSLASRRQIPANEHLTMQIAAQIYGIETAANGICFDRKGRPVYITKRFDILPDGTKAQMEDFATLCGRNEQTDGSYFKYSGNYEEIAVAIKRYVAAWPVATARFFKLVVFNYIYGNGDAHLKNFSVIRKSDELQLAPAYDLLNTSVHIDGDDLGLSGGLLASGWKSNVFDRTGHPCRTDFRKFGLEIGMAEQRVDSILTEFATLPEAVGAMVGNSFFDAKTKRAYLASVNTRIARFNRISD